MKLSKIAEILNIEFDGDDIEIRAINSLDEANGDELSYCDGEKNIKFLQNTKAGAVLISKEMPKPVNSIALICENPHLAFAILSEYYAKKLLKNDKPNKISQTANIMPNVHIGSGVKIGERSLIMSGAFIGDGVEIGDDCVIYPNVVIYNDVKISNRCKIHANSVIGSDGFGYAHTKDGRHVKIYHNGDVIIEDDVEIGACSTIDRAVFGHTLIKKGAKIDNLVQIGHNCNIGENSILVSQVGLAGSTTLGRNVVMGGQSGSGGHVKVGDFAQIAARGGVSKDLAGFKAYAGHPIMELKEWFKLNAKISLFFKKK